MVIIAGVNKEAFGNEGYFSIAVGERHSKHFSRSRELFPLERCLAREKEKDLIIKCDRCYQIATVR